MRRTSSAMLIRRFDRRSPQSSRQDSHQFGVFFLRGYEMGYSTMTFTPPGVLGSVNTSNANFKSWPRLGVPRGTCGAVCSIHGAAHTGSRDLYEVLGVAKNSSTSEIKKSYYGLAKKLHPDTNQADADPEKKFQEIQEAYEVLKDEKKRLLYDQVGHEQFKSTDRGSGGPFDSRGPFEDIFSRGPDDVSGPMQFGGSNVKLSLELSFMEAIQGCTKIVTFETAVPCKTCGGKGFPRGTRPEICKRCKGAGMTSVRSGQRLLQSTCPSCGGSGQFVSNLCNLCNGYCIVKGTKSIKLNIMPGVEDDEVVMSRRSGGADPAGGQAGDLYVTIKICKDPVFRRQGSNIHVDAVLSVSQAKLGGTIEVPTLTGEVFVKVQPGTKSGQKMTLKGKGIKTRGALSFGDHVVHFVVNAASNLAQQENRSMEEFEEEGGEGECGRAAATAT